MQRIRERHFCECKIYDLVIASYEKNSTLLGCLMCGRGGLSGLLPEGSEEAQVAELHFSCPFFTVGGLGGGGNLYSEKLRIH